MLFRTGQIYPSFVANTTWKLRLVIDYKRANDCLASRTFRMDQLYDVAPELLRGDHLFKADLTNGYYHLRLRRVDGLRLAVFVDSEVFIPLCLNCGLSVAPRFFTTRKKKEKSSEDYGARGCVPAQSGSSRIFVHRRLQVVDVRRSSSGWRDRLGWARQRGLPRQRV